nr:unnamed protein product [Digitaria exilis]
MARSGLENRGRHSLQCHTAAVLQNRKPSVADSGDAMGRRPPRASGAAARHAVAARHRLVPGSGRCHTDTASLSTLVSGVLSTEAEEHTKGTRVCAPPRTKHFGHGSARRQIEEGNQKGFGEEEWARKLPETRIVTDESLEQIGYVFRGGCKASLASSFPVVSNMLIALYAFQDRMRRRLDWLRIRDPSHGNAGCNGRCWGAFGHGRRRKRGFSFSSSLSVLRDNASTSFFRLVPSPPATCLLAAPPRRRPPAASRPLALAPAFPRRRLHPPAPRSSEICVRRRRFLLPPVSAGASVVARAPPPSLPAREIAFVYSLRSSGPLAREPAICFLGPPLVRTDPLVAPRQVTGETLASPTFPPPPIAGNRSTEGSGGIRDLSIEGFLSENSPSLVLPPPQSSVHKRRHQQATGGFAAAVTPALDSC